MIQRYVNIGFVLAGLLAWMLSGALLAAVLDWINPDWNIPLIGMRFLVSDLGGILVGISTAVSLRRSERINILAVEVGNEVKKVTWPTWPETRTATIVVLITAFIVAAILGLFDAMWSWATGFVYDTGRVFTFFSAIGIAVIVSGTALLFYYASRD